MVTATKKTKSTKAKSALKTTDITNGNHLTVTQNKDGTVSMKWDWDKLLEEVRAACATVKINLIEATETKVKKTRAKKSK